MTKPTRPPAAHRGKEGTTRRKNRMTLHLIIGIVLGSAAGYAYYRFIGCASGACPLTSNPYISTLYGALMGALFSGAFGR
jgi:hypothetical protein